MSGPSLITKTFRGDLDRAALLFESVDAHVRGYRRHYVIVDDDDRALFARFAGERRSILAASEFLPAWLHALPPWIGWAGRRRWWSFRAPPVSGWHIQQLVKIEAVASLPETRFCLIDSDNVFFRPFDVARWADRGTVPLYIDPDAVGNPARPHVRWTETAHRLLGLPRPVFPADDFIGQMIVWDQRTVRAMTARIEAVTGTGWATALCRAHSFSEYILYGAFARHDVAERLRHDVTRDSPCCAHWDYRTPDRAGVLALLRGSSPGQVALCVQSFNATPLETIRNAIATFMNETRAARETAPGPVDPVDPVDQ